MFYCFADYVNLKPNELVIVAIAAQILIPELIISKCSYCLILIP